MKYFQKLFQFLFPGISIKEIPDLQIGLLHVYTFGVKMHQSLIMKLKSWKFSARKSFPLKFNQIVRISGGGRTVHFPWQTFGDICHVICLDCFEFCYFIWVIFVSTAWLIEYQTEFLILPSRFTRTSNSTSDHPNDPEFE